MAIKLLIRLRVYQKKQKLQQSSAQKSCIMKSSNQIKQVIKYQKKDIYLQKKDKIKMEYQNIANLIDNASNQPSKFRTKNWVETNDESRGIYNVNSQIKLKNTMLKSSLFDYGDAYILVKRTITVNNTAAADVDASNTSKKVTFKNCVPFTNCISEINNTQVDNAKDIDIVMPMCNLINRI